MDFSLWRTGGRHGVCLGKVEGQIPCYEPVLKEFVTSRGERLRFTTGLEPMVREVAEMVIELSGGGSELAFGPLPEDDPKRRCPDITRARESLGWEPRTPAREGLERTLNWFAGRQGTGLSAEASPAGRGGGA